ncbi:MAG: NUDIX domain-containing protein [Candidatus Aenigmatarchaeota archaeon]
MIKKVSCGAIVFYKENDNIEFLVLKYPNYWGFPKGEKEKNESEIEAAKREIKEETNLDVEFIPGFRREYEYSYWLHGKLIRKRAIFFLARAKSKDVKISWEHEDFKWLNFEEAIKLLNFEEDKENLKLAYEFIKKLNL